MFSYPIIANPLLLSWEGLVECMIRHEFSNVSKGLLVNIHVSHGSVYIYIPPLCLLLPQTKSIMKTCYLPDRMSIDGIRLGPFSTQGDLYRGESY